MNGKEQKVVINTDHESNQVFVDDSLVGSGKSVETKFARDFKAKEVRIERDGQESRTYARIQTKKSPLYFFSVVPFGITFYAPFMDSHPKAFNYGVTDEVYSTAGDEVVKKEGQKNIYVNKAEINMNAGDFVVQGINYKKYSRGDMTPNRYGSSNTQGINFNSIGVQGILNEILHQREYLDTTKTILKQKTNTLYIDAEITKWTNNNVYRSFINAGATSFMYGEVEIKWILRDVYKQVLHEELIVITTDQYRGITVGLVGTENSTDSPFEQVFKNAMEKSMVEFLRLDEVKNFLPIEEEKELTEPYVIVNKAKIASKLPESIKASVTIIPNEDSHGSGFFISENHIITNFHVIAGNDTVKIVDNAGTEMQGIVVRSSEQYDLAIVKLENYESEFALPLQSARKEELGEDIFAIGTPSSLEFTQTLSKGIVSGRRKSSQVDYIQTDVSINPGNSGGPLVDTKGSLIGVVNAKLVGSDIEGIGFGIPADKIVEFLKLELK
ncbi:MAG: trypsin-like peptidase domain-containing protein [Flavobacteriales bacterium]|nr:trypsin-like peptidase domain-containing protein [Flavobacteriales bacterium]